MKELLKKFTALFSESLEKLENNQVNEAVEKMQELSSVVEEIAKSETIEKEHLEKAVQEEVKKYAEMYIAAEDVKSLVEQIKQAQASIQEVQKQVDELKKEKQQDDKIIEKTLNDLVENVEKISSTLISKVK